MSQSTSVPVLGEVTNTAVAANVDVIKPKVEETAGAAVPVVADLEANPAPVQVAVVEPKKEEEAAIEVKPAEPAVQEQPAEVVAVAVVEEIAPAAVEVAPEGVPAVAAAEPEQGTQPVVSLEAEEKPASPPKSGDKRKADAAELENDENTESGKVPKIESV